MASSVGEALDELVPLYENRLNLHKLSTIAEGRLVPFIGAGLSIAFGFPPWTAFLTDTARRGGIGDEVVALLDAGQYEEACERIFANQGKAVFENAVQQTFGAAPQDVSVAAAAAAVLPRIAKGPVITTNFDHVLETVYTRLGNPFKHVVWGGRSSAISDALFGDDHYLLKIHGDADDRADRVFTKSDYVQHYGSDDPDAADYSRPLPAALRRMFTTRSMLFLGCSLQNDRTTRLLKSIAAADSGIPVHFAVIEMPAEAAVAQERLRALSNSNILPIVYRTSLHDDLRAILEALTDPVSLRRVTRDRMPAGLTLDPARAISHADSARLAGAFAAAREGYRTLFEGEDTDMDMRARAGAVLALCEYQLGDLASAAATLDTVLGRFAEWLTPEALFIAEITRPSVLFASGGWDDAKAAFEALLARAPALMWRERCELYKRSNMFLLYDEALPLLQAAETELAGHEDDALFWEVKHNIACNELLLGHDDRAKELFESCLAALRMLSHYRAAYPLNNLGIINLRKGLVGEARRQFREIAGMQVTSFEQISAECHLAILDAVTRKIDRAYVSLKTLAARVESSSEAVLQDLVFHNLAWVEHLGGHDESALRHLRSGIPIRRNLWFDQRRAMRERNERRITGQPPLPSAPSTRRDTWLFETEWEFSDLWFWE